MEWNVAEQKYLTEQRFRAGFVLQQLQTAVLLQLQQLEMEDAYLDDRTNKIERVWSYWDNNLIKIQSMANLIWLQVSKYKVKENPGMLPDNRIKTRSEAASNVITAKNYETLSVGKSNHSLYLTTKESKPPTTNPDNLYSTIKDVHSNNKIIQKDTSTLTSFIETLSPTHSTSAYSSRTVSTNQSNANNCKDIPKHLERIPIVNSGSQQTSIDTHKSIIYTNQPINFLSENNLTRGLSNLGSTCYMNSILQCLSHTLPLREFYVSDEYKQFLNKRGDLSSAFKRVMLELWDSTSQLPVDPYDLRREVKARTDRFPDNTQHDAHEFMGFLLNELHEEINRASVEGRKSPADNETLREACARHLTWEDSRISELFGGMLRSEVCCSVCSDKSIVCIPFLDIALPIQKKTDESYYHYYSSSDPALQLDTCLKIFTAAETLDGEERPYCNKCNALTRSTKQLTVAKLPRLLIIQLKRFSGNQIRRKLYTPVRFHEIWRLSDVSKKAHIYSLYGVVSHSGGMYGGHYIAYCKYGNDWRCFDDSFTRSYRVSWEIVKCQEAYILFYEQVTH